MQSSFEPFAFLLLALLASSAYALPILPSHTTHPFAILSPDTTSVSPRISCINLKGQSICERFEIRIPLQEFTASSLYTRPFNSVKGSELLSAEDRQIHRIMEAKEGEIRVSDEQPWMTPDIQVVLWFIFLCCLMEGTLSGFRWWRKDTKAVLERRSPEKNIDGHGFRKIDKEDEDDDDEVNIPVL